MCFEHSMVLDALPLVLIHHKIIETHHVLHTLGLARLSLFLFFLFLTSMFFSVSHIVGVFLTSLFLILLSLLCGSCLCFLRLPWPAMGRHIQPKKTPPPKAHQKLQTQQHVGLLLMFACTVSVTPPGAVEEGSTSEAAMIS